MIRALTFDTYGTVVDWRSSVLGELRSLAARHGLTLDCARFLEDWKAVYRPAMDRVNRGESPWTTVDAIYRQRLDELLVTYGVTGLTTGEVDALVRVWWRLSPWPDAVPGLQRLKRRYIVSPPFPTRASSGWSSSLGSRACRGTASSPRRMRAATSPGRKSIERPSRCSVFAR